MDLNYRTMARMVGLLFLIVGFAMCLPMIVGIGYKETSSSLSFFKTAVPCIMVGAIIVFLIKPSKGKLKKRDGFLIVSGSWLILSLLGAIPFVLDGCIPNYANAFFESCSGFSTTGASILNDIEVLPKSMLFWRCFTHWIGGMGILVFAVALLPTLGIAGQTIVKSEAPGPTLSKITPKMSDMAKALYVIYGSCTLIETILLMLGGMNWFDAVTHTFATVGTGGFSNYNDSVSHFDSAYIDGVITVFMIMSGVNFNLYFVALKGKLNVFWKDIEFKLYIIIIAVTSAFITLSLFLSNTYSSIGESFRYASFQVASIITTTGFSTADYDVWPTFCILAIFLLFFIGGCSSSTGGGVKVIRVVVLLKMVKRTIALKLHPNAMVKIKIDNKILPTDTVQEICSFAFLYIVMIFFVGIIVSIDGHDIMTNFGAAASCLGNIGPGFNDVGPSMNYSFFSSPIKIVLSLAMIAGRLELFTFLMLIAPKFWNPSR